MFQDVLLGGYIPGNSLIHKMDPRAKLCCSLLIFVGLFCSAGVISLGATLVFIGFAALLTDTGLKTWTGSMRKFALMLGVTFLLNVFFVQEGSLITIDGVTLPFTEIGFHQATMLTGRIIGAICVSLLITATTTPYRLALAISRIARPLEKFGMHSARLGTLAAISMRFIPLLQLEVRQIVESQLSRGVDFSSGSIAAGCRKLSSILVPALAAAVARGEIVATAMTVRGFNPSKPRTEFRPLKFTGPDYYAVGVTFFFTAMTLFL